MIELVCNIDSCSTLQISIVLSGADLGFIKGGGGGGLTQGTNLLGRGV